VNKALNCAACVCISQKERLASKLSSFLNEIKAFFQMLTLGASSRSFSTLQMSKITDAVSVCKIATLKLIYIRLQHCTCTLSVGRKVDQFNRFLQPRNEELNKTKIKQMGKIKNKGKVFMFAISA